ncbi:DUF2513 domain-containing protein [Veillonella parvula]|uniref:DUF2513 domain-containing protein n=1 Tax=Veillonella parvula TaxID=29466 RepID=UPI000E68B64D|nr:DUF2513 domain-containing protein [Veillonella parvula]RIW10912.1 DUF2513 domain-containing protein [Veillonella parvula]
MKIDYSLCRDILLTVQNSPLPSVNNNDSINFPDINRIIIDYHIHILVYNGLLSGKNASSKSRDYLYLDLALTHDGQQFVDLLSSDTIWNKVKDYAIQKAIPLTFDTLIHIAQSLL